MKLVLVFAVLQIVWNTQNLPVIIGKGVDIHFSNPDLNTADLSLRLRLFNFTFNQQQKTEDQLYIIPDYAYTEGLATCSFKTQINQFQGAFEWRKNKFSSFVGGVDIYDQKWGKGWLENQNFAFSKNGMFQDYVQDTLKYGVTSIEARSFCEVYQVNIDWYNHELTDGFIYQVLQLLNSSDTSIAINQLFDKFGSYYI